MTLHQFQVLRVFGHNDGYGTTMPVQNPIQPRPGVFSEVALRRFDFVMNALAEVCSGKRVRGSLCVTCSGHEHLTVQPSSGL